MKFIIISPTINDWLQAIREQREKLLNPRPQMTVLLDHIREDVYNQFDEKQGEWKPLREYTIDKKTAADKDLRILHETNEGEGLRLRDAYRQAGYVDNEGLLVWEYPAEKPYAEELDKGANLVDARVGRGASAKNLVAEEARLDREFDEMFGIDNDDIFKKPRKPRQRRRR